MFVRQLWESVVNVTTYQSRCNLNFYCVSRVALGGPRSFTASFSFTYIRQFGKNKFHKYPFSLQCQDSNPESLHQESFPIATS